MQKGNILNNASAVSASLSLFWKYLKRTFQSSRLPPQKHPEASRGLHSWIIFYKSAIISTFSRPFWHQNCRIPTSTCIYYSPFNERFMHFVVSHEYNIFQKISKIALAGYQNGAKKASFYFVIVKLERNVQNFHRNICCYQLLSPNLQKIKRPWFVDEKNIYQREKQSLFWTFQHGKSTLFVLFFGNDKKMTIFDNVRLKNTPYFCFVKDEKRVKTEV